MLRQGLPVLGEISKPQGSELALYPGMSTVIQLPDQVNKLELSLGFKRDFAAIISCVNFSPIRNVDLPEVSVNGRPLSWECSEKAHEVPSGFRQGETIYTTTYRGEALLGRAAAIQIRIGATTSSDVHQLTVPEAAFHFPPTARSLLAIDPEGLFKGDGTLNARLGTEASVPLDARTALDKFGACLEIGDGNHRAIHTLQQAFLEIDRNTRFCAQEFLPLRVLEAIDARTKRIYDDAQSLLSSLGASDSEAADELRVSFKVFRAAPKRFYPAAYQDADLYEHDVVVFRGESGLKRAIVSKRGVAEHPSDTGASHITKEFTAGLFGQGLVDYVERSSQPSLVPGVRVPIGLAPDSDVDYYQSGDEVVFDSSKEEQRTIQFSDRRTDRGRVVAEMHESDRGTRFARLSEFSPNEYASQMRLSTSVAFRRQDMSELGIDETLSQLRRSINHERDRHREILEGRFAQTPDLITHPALPVLTAKLNKLQLEAASVVTSFSDNLARRAGGVLTPAHQSFEAMLAEQKSIRMAADAVRLASVALGSYAQLPAGVPSAEELGRLTPRELVRQIALAKAAETGAHGDAVDRQTRVLCGMIERFEARVEKLRQIVHDSTAQHSEQFRIQRFSSRIVPYSERDALKPAAISVGNRVFQQLRLEPDKGFLPYDGESLSRRLNSRQNEVIAVYPERLGTASVEPVALLFYYTPDRLPPEVRESLLKRYGTVGVYVSPLVCDPEYAGAAVADIALNALLVHIQRTDAQMHCGRVAERNPRSTSVQLQSGALVNPADRSVVRSIDGTDLTLRGFATISDPDLRAVMYNGTLMISPLELERILLQPGAAA